MSSLRQTSLDPVDIPSWRWAPFLEDAIAALADMKPEQYPVDKDFLDWTGFTGSKLKPFEVKISTWACKTDKLRQVRAACVEAGSAASVLNFVASPFYSYDLPFFGADFVTLPSGHLLALDLQPALKSDRLHTEAIWERLVPIFEYWQRLLPGGGSIPEEAKQFFSPGFLWTRLPLGNEGDNLIESVVRPAFRDYLGLYLEIVSEAEQVSEDRAAMLYEGQKSYLTYRAKNDPARGMLTRFCGGQWTESYIHRVLFDL